MDQDLLQQANPVDGALGPLLPVVVLLASLLLPSAWPPDTDSCC